jgi:hypothetical protein
VTIGRFPFGGALEPRNFVSKFDRHHSARTGTKGLSIMLARHLRCSHSAQQYSGALMPVDLFLCCPWQVGHRFAQSLYNTIAWRLVTGKGAMAEDEIVGKTKPNICSRLITPGARSCV